MTIALTIEQENNKLKASSCFSKHCTFKAIKFLSGAIISEVNKLLSISKNPTGALLSMLRSD